MERTIKRIALNLVIACIPHQYLFSQSKSFEKAIEKGNFGKIERIVKRKIKEQKHGVEFFNGPGSGMQISFEESFDSIVNWLLLHKGVQDATWDKCQIKVAIYPGSSTIGVVFKTKNGMVEKCFKVQKGTTGQPYIFGWRPVLFKSKMKLVYKGSVDCEGFVEKQKILCKK
jgi:hypothetical protein